MLHGNANSRNTNQRGFVPITHVKIHVAPCSANPRRHAQVSNSKFRRSPDGRTYRKRGKSPPFVMLPRYLLYSAAWKALSGTEAKGFIEILTLYNGSNNGHLLASTRWLAKRMNCSNDTAARVIRRLIEVGFLEIVRRSGFNVKTKLAAEYRLTLYHCDATNKTPSKEFMRWSPQSDPSDCGNISQYDARGSRSDPSNRHPQQKPSQSDPSDYQGPNEGFHSPTHQTHLESTTALRGRASAPIASAVASEPGRSEQPRSVRDRGSCSSLSSSNRALTSSKRKTSVTRQWGGMKANRMSHSDALHK
jgi:Helix-turn-helix domain